MKYSKNHTLSVLIEATNTTRSWAVNLCIKFLVIFPSQIKNFMNDDDDDDDDDVAETETNYEDFKAELNGQ